MRAGSKSTLKPNSPIFPISDFAPNVGGGKTKTTTNHPSIFDNSHRLLGAYRQSNFNAKIFGAIAPVCVIHACVSPDIVSGEESTGQSNPTQSMRSSIRRSASHQCLVLSYRKPPQRSSIAGTLMPSSVRSSTISVPPKGRPQNSA